MSEEEHKHTFVFLRAEKQHVYGVNMRIDQTTHYDIFFCTECLEYRRVRMKVVKPLGFGDEIVTWRNA